MNESARRQKRNTGFPSRAVIVFTIGTPILVLMLSFSVLYNTHDFYQEHFITKFVEINGVVVTSGVTMLGLLLASLAILIGFPESKLLLKMRKKGQYLNLLLTIGINILFFLLSVVLGYFLLLTGITTNVTICLVIALILSCLVAFIMLLYKFGMVLCRLNQEMTKVDTDRNPAEETDLR